MLEDYSLLSKAFEAAKTLFIAEKFSEAKTLFADVLSRLAVDDIRHENVSGCGNNSSNDDNSTDTLPSAVELHVFLAECLSRQADQIRERGLNQPIIKASSSSSSSSDSEEDSEDYSASSRKRRRMGPLPPRSFSSAESINADVIRFKQLLHEALKEVENGLSLSAVLSSSSSSSTSVRCLLILGAEILIKLASLGPSISPAVEAASLRHQALAMIDKLENDDDDSKWPVDEASGNHLPSSDNDSLRRREWRVLYQLHHRRYSKLVESHTARYLVRNVKRTLFLTGTWPRTGDEDVVTGTSSSYSTSSLPERHYAFPSIDDALNFALPDLFDEALDPDKLDRTSTFVLLPKKREKLLREREEEEEEEKETIFGEESKTLKLVEYEKELNRDDQTQDESSFNVKREEEEEEKEEDDEEEELRALMDGVSDLSFDDETKDHDYRSAHICFYNQRFYRLQRLPERSFIVQLIFCNLCVVDENLDAVFFLRGLVPQPLDGTTDVEFCSSVDDVQEVEEEDEDDEEELVVQQYSFNPDFLDDLGFSELHIDDDKSVYETLFPAIRSVF